MLNTFQMSQFGDFKRDSPILPLADTAHQTVVLGYVVTFDGVSSNLNPTSISYSAYSHHLQGENSP